MLSRRVSSEFNILFYQVLNIIKLPIMLNNNYYIKFQVVGVAEIFNMEILRFHCIFKFSNVIENFSGTHTNNQNDFIIMSNG